MNILIVGANSILSQELIRLLNLDNRHSVYGLCNINTNNLRESAEYLNIEELPNIDIDFDVVYFVASYIPYGNWEATEKKLIDTNIRLLLQVSSLCEKAQMIYCSSVSVYGEQEGVIDEKTELRPSNPYAISKLSGEIIVKSHKVFDIVRFSSIYGPDIDSPTFIPRAIRQAKENDEIVIFGDGSRKQNYIHVEDAALFLYHCLEKKSNSIYLGVSDQSVSNKEIAELIAKNMEGISITFKGSDLSNSAIFDNSFSRQELSIDSMISIEDGIQELTNGK